MSVRFGVGEEIDRDDFLRKLIKIQFERNDVDFHRGTFRVRGDTVDIFPAHQQEQAYRVRFFGDEIEAITVIDHFADKKSDKPISARFFLHLIM